MRSTGRLPIEVEEGLWELVATGTVTADGFDNLRALMDPKRRRGDQRPSRLRRRKLRPRVVAGRWSLLSAASIPVETSDSEACAPDLETVALQLLECWGVVFRDLLAREPLAPPGGSCFVSTAAGKPREGSEEVDSWQASWASSLPCPRHLRPSGRSDAISPRPGEGACVPSGPSQSDRNHPTRCPPSTCLHQRSRFQKWPRARQHQGGAEQHPREAISRTRDRFGPTEE